MAFAAVVSLLAAMKRIDVVDTPSAPSRFPRGEPHPESAPEEGHDENTSHDGARAGGGEGRPGCALPRERPPRSRKLPPARQAAGPSSFACYHIRQDYTGIPHACQSNNDPCDSRLPAPDFLPRGGAQTLYFRPPVCYTSCIYGVNDGGVSHGARRRGVLRRRLRKGSRGGRAGEENIRATRSSSGRGRGLTIRRIRGRTWTSCCSRAIPEWF